MSSADPPLVEARGLTRRYGPVRALAELDLTLRPGEVLLLLGPNGAGKSTLLRALAGLLRPTGGSVWVNGLELGRDQAATRRPIGLLSHQSLLYDELTLQENLTLAARLYDLPNPRDRARQALEAEGLESRAASRPRDLSRGLLQRAAIARALLHDPALLLLDEPFTGLDAIASARLRETLRQRATPARALVLVTHQAAEGWDLATRVGVLADGRWALQSDCRGSLSEFQARYEAILRG